MRDSDTIIIMAQGKHVRGCLILVECITAREKILTIIQRNF